MMKRYLLLLAIASFFLSNVFATVQKDAVIHIGNLYKTSYWLGAGSWKGKDNGIGIPDAIKEKIMQPFFTTKPTGEGTVLGLSLTYDMVVEGHGGTIQVNSVDGEGSEFIVELPVATKSQNN